MIKTKTCPVCYSNYVRDFNKAIGPMTTAKLATIELPAAFVTSYSLCYQCGVVFQNPRMSDSEIDVYYSSGTYRATIEMTTEQMDEDELRRARVDAGILNLGDIKPERHLDIGCSRGYFLREVGAPVKYGVDLNPLWIDPDIKDIEVQPRVAKLPDMEFDLISMLHILEHEPNPMLMLKEVVSRLSRDGTLMIEVPSDGSPGGWARLAHLFHFQPWVLSRMLDKLGLEVTSMLLSPHTIVFAKIRSF